MKKLLITLIISFLFLCNCFEQKIIFNKEGKTGSIVYKIQYYEDFNNLILLLYLTKKS